MKQRSRKSVIAFLLMLSLVLTTGTFAYWASAVNGTSTEATGTLNVGSGDNVSTKFVLSNEFQTGGFLVPVGHKYNSHETTVVESINLNYDIKWVEDENTTQLLGTTTVGKVQVTYEITITNNDHLLDANIHRNIYDLINVEYDLNNPEELVLEEDAKTFSYEISMNEPKDKAEYDLIAKSIIVIEFTFKISDSDIVTEDNDLRLPIIDNPVIEDNQEGPYVSLNGDATVYVEVSETYNDPGATAYDSNGNEINHVWTGGSVNFWKVGTYERTYSAYSQEDNQTITTTRTIVVVDTTAPVITLNGSDVFRVIAGTYYSDWGAWAQDNSNEYVSVEVEGAEDVNPHVPGIYYVVYTSVDSSGNEARVVRTVIVE